MKNKFETIKKEKRKYLSLWEADSLPLVPLGKPKETLT